MTCQNQSYKVEGHTVLTFIGSTTWHGEECGWNRYKLISVKAATVGTQAGGVNLLNRSCFSQDWNSSTGVQARSWACDACMQLMLTIGTLCSRFCAQHTVCITLFSLSQCLETDAVPISPLPNKKTKVRRGDLICLKKHC